MLCYLVFSVVVKILQCLDRKTSYFILDITNKTPLTGADEQQKENGDPPAIRQTLLPIYMGRYCAFQDSSEDSGSPSEQQSDTESDLSNVSEGKWTLPAQIAKNVLKSISGKLSLKSIHESRKQESPNHDAVMINHTFTESLAKSSIRGPLPVQAANKFKAAPLNLKHQAENDPESHEAVDNLEGVNVEDLQERNGSFPVKENPRDSDGRRHSEDAEICCPVKSQARYRREMHGHIRSFNGEVLIPNHNLSGENSESDSKSNGLKSTEFNLIETKPLLHMVSSSKEPDNEINHTKDEVSKRGADDLMSLRNNDAEWAGKVSSTEADRIVPMHQEHSESRNICQAVKSTQGKRKIEEFNAFKGQSLMANGENSSSEPCYKKAVSRERLENDYNAVDGSWKGKTFNCRGNSMEQNLLLGLTNEQSRSISLSSLKKSNDPDLCTPTWTAKEFVVRNSHPDYANSSSSPVKPASVSKLKSDLKNCPKRCSTESGDVRCDLKTSQLESEKDYLVGRDMVDNSRQSIHWREKHSNLRHDKPMSFDSLDADYHESTTRNKISPSSQLYIYYEPEEIVLVRERIAMAGHDTYLRGVQKGMLHCFYQKTVVADQIS